MEKDIKFPNLVAEMAKQGETQTSLAEMLGITKQTINLKFKGKSDWTLGEVEQICEYLKKDYYQLFIKRK